MITCAICDRGEAVRCLKRHASGALELCCLVCGRRWWAWSPILGASVPDLPGRVRRGLAAAERAEVMLSAIRRALADDARRRAEEYLAPALFPVSEAVRKFRTNVGTTPTVVLLSPALADRWLALAGEVPCELLGAMVRIDPGLAGERASALGDLGYATPFDPRLAAVLSARLVPPGRYAMGGRMLAAD